MVIQPLIDKRSGRYKKVADITDRFILKLVRQGSAQGRNHTRTYKNWQIIMKDGVRIADAHVQWADALDALMPDWLQVLPEGAITAFEDDEDDKQKLVAAALAKMKRIRRRTAKVNKELKALDKSSRVIEKELEAALEDAE